MSNPFEGNMEALPDIELFQILRQRNDYQQLAIETAESEIKKRNFSKTQVAEISAQIEAMETKRKRKRNYYSEIRKKIISIIETVIVPINFSSPSMLVNSIDVLIIINV